MSDTPFDLAALIASGHTFTKSGSEWGVVTPDQRSGFGATPEDALLNVGAQILHDPTLGRVLVRESGAQVYLDTAAVERATPAVIAEAE